MQETAVQAFLEQNFEKVAQVTPMMETIRSHETELYHLILRRIKHVATAVPLVMIAREIRRMAGYAVAMADDGANRILAPAA